MTQIAYEWQRAIVDQVDVMNNKELLDEVLSFVGFDGDLLAPVDQWKYGCLKAELYNRLKEWLEQ